MPQTIETASFGTTLAYANTDYTSPTTIAKVSDFDPAEYEVQEVPSFHLTSTGQVETSQPGWIKPGKAKVVIIHTAAAVAALEALVGVLKGWIVTYVDGSTEKMNGYITKKGHKVDGQKLLMY